MRQGDIVWASLPGPDGRRPVVVVTRNSALEFLTSVTVGPLTTTIRRSRSFIPLTPGEDGVFADCAINCDRLLTVPADQLGERIASLSSERRKSLRDAIQFALGFDALTQDGLAH